MEEPHNLYFRHLRSRLGGIVGEMTRVHHITLAENVDEVLAAALARAKPKPGARLRSTKEPPRSR